MNKLVPVALGVLVLGLAAPAVAEPSAKYQACMDRAHGSTVQLGLCAQTELAAQDARLNKAYQQVMHQLAHSPERQTALRDEERSWIKQRDYQCKIDGDTIDNSCLVGKTTERADALEKQVRF
jgi:uncharacterized protein YecT (DUF1311 family)